MEKNVILILLVVVEEDTETFISIPGPLLMGRLTTRLIIY